MSTDTTIFFKGIDFNTLCQILEESVGLKLSRFKPYTDGIAYYGSCFGIDVYVFDSHTYSNGEEIFFEDYQLEVSFERKNRRISLELIDELRVIISFVVAEMILLEEECEYIIVDDLQILLKKYPE